MKALLLGAAIGGALAATDDWSNPERAWAKIIISALVDTHGLTPMAPTKIAERPISPAVAPHHEAGAGAKAGDDGHLRPSWAGQESVPAAATAASVGTLIVDRVFETWAGCMCAASPPSFRSSPMQEVYTVVNSVSCFIRAYFK